MTKKMNRSALLLLLTYSFTLFLQRDYLLQYTHAKSLDDSSPFRARPLDDTDDDGGGGGGAVGGGEMEYLSSGDDDDDSDLHLHGYNVNSSFSPYAYPNSIVSVHFLPPLVQTHVLENATANQFVAQVRANVTTNLSPNYLRLQSSNQIRSQQLTKQQQTILNQNFQIYYRLLNHRNIFAIDRNSGAVSLLSQLPPSNYTYILDVETSVRNTNSSSHPYSKFSYEYTTKVPVSIEVIDINNNEPEPVKNEVNCIAYDTIDTTTPLCTASFRDSDRGVNARLSYSLSSDDLSSGKTNNLIINSKTGSIYRRNASLPLVPGEITSEIILATDFGAPFLETSVNSRIKILDANKAHLKHRGFNEKPYLQDIQRLNQTITLTGDEEPGDSLVNLSPVDPDEDIVTMHIVEGDPDGLFAIHSGTLIVAKTIDHSEKKTHNLVIMLTDGKERSYVNIAVAVPKIVRGIPNKYSSTTVRMSGVDMAPAESSLIDVSRFANDSSFARYKLYSASSKEAYDHFKVDSISGVVSTSRKMDFNMNGLHTLMISIEDNRLSPENFRSFVDLNIDVNLLVPPVPTTTTTSTTTTTTTTTTTSTTTTTTTTTTTPRPTTTSTTTTSTTTTQPPSTYRPTSTTTTTMIPYRSSITPSATPSRTSTTTTTAPTVPAVIYSAPTIPAINQSPEVPVPHYPVYPYDTTPDPPVQQTPWPPTVGNIPPTISNPTVNDKQVSVRTLIAIVIAIMAALFVLACLCLICRCCCRTSSRSKRYRDKNGALLDRSSFHSQQRLHHGNHHGHSSNMNGSMSRNMNSRLSLRTPNHMASANARGAHSK